MLLHVSETVSSGETDRIPNLPWDVVPLDGFMEHGSGRHVSDFLTVAQLPLHRCHLPDTDDDDSG